MQTEIGDLIKVAQGNGLYMLAFDTNGQEGGLLILRVISEDYRRLFPAGDPALNDEYEVQFEQDGNNVTRVMSVFNLSSEVIPADMVPTLTATTNLEESGIEYMNKQKFEEQLASRLSEITDDDALMADIQTAMDAEQAEHEERIKARQSGVGLEALFTDAEVAQFGQSTQNNPTIDLSATTEKSGDRQFGDGGQ